MHIEGGKIVSILHHAPMRGNPPNQPKPTHGKNNPVTHDDRQLFLETIGATRGEVRKLRPHGKAHTLPPPPVARLQTRLRQKENGSASLPYLSDHDPYALPGTEAAQHTVLPTDTHGFHRVSVPPQTLRRLRQGKQRIEATLDLHGCTVDEARQQVAWLLQRPASGRYPGESLCVRIIHGQGTHSPQGRGKLKRLLHIWLPQSERVLAFCPARSNDGGSGALYVLLRNTP